MKTFINTFINVLYRRILYKIPLKFLLVLLAIVCVFIATTKAETINWVISDWSLSAWESAQFGSIIWDTECFYSTSSSCNSITISNWQDSTTWNPYQHLVCLVHWTTERSTFRNNSNSYCTFKLVRWEFKTLYTMTSLDCQTEYNLIPISSVDQNYCTTNNLCPASECPVCPVWTGSISNVYINDILHVGAPFIFIDIPEEISWDYGYTQWWTNMLVSVEWYNVDYDYINWVVDVQSYKPDSEDLTNIVKTVLPLFVPWLCIILLLYFIFKFIKKIF